MHLTKLSLRKLFGTLDKEVIFNNDLNLLVGINGSGKTSVLNVIDWLLAPNLPRLCTTPFEKLALHFSYSKVNYIFEATQSSSQLTLLLKKGRKSWSPITVKLNRDPQKIEPAEIEELLERYGGLSPEKPEMPLWNFLAKLPKPVVIALDRSISAEANNKIYLDIESRLAGARRPSKGKSPLDKVREVTSDYATPASHF